MSVVYNNTVTKENTNSKYFLIKSLMDDYWMLDHDSWSMSHETDNRSVLQRYWYRWYLTDTNNNHIKQLKYA